MRDRLTEGAKLRNLLESPDSHAELEAFLVSSSKLPGPRANLGLAKAFADQVGAHGPSDELPHVLRGWLAIPANDAPTGNPREFLPFCALQALGTLHCLVAADRRDEILALIRAGTSDDRWRVREGAAIALQRIGLKRADDLIAIGDSWLPAATLLEQRAIVAALAEPPVLRAPETARYALGVTDQILANVRALDPATRKREEFRVLRQALEYGISVMVAALPEEGFACMRAWAASDDPDIARILRANLGKARLSKKYGDEVERVMGVMGDRWWVRSVRGPEW